MLGDKTPSMFLASMTAMFPPGLKLGDSDVNDFLFRFHFLSRLPDEVRCQLSQYESESLAKIAKRADVMMARRKSCSNSRQVHNVQGESDHVEEVAAVRSQPRRTPSSSRSSLCWYHDKFADKATECLSPCHWSGNGQASRV